MEQPATRPETPLSDPSPSAAGARRLSPIRRSRPDVNRRARTALAFGFLLAAAAACRTVPPYVGLTAPELFDYANAAYEREDWDEAILAYERLVLGAPGFNQMAEARLRLAQSYYQKGEYVTASSEFLRFSTTFPTHELMPDAALGLCRAHSELSPIPDRDQRYTVQAIDSCQTVRLDYPDTPQAGVADSLWTDMREKLARKDLDRGEFYFDRGLLDSGLVFFEDVVEQYPETTSAPSALLFIVRTYERLGYEEDASEARQRLLELYPDSDAAQEIRDVV